MANLELICDDKNLCGEGPLWDPKREKLIWNDCSASLLFEYDPKTKKHDIISRGLMIAGLALNHDGRLVVAGSTGLHLWQASDRFVTLLSESQGEVLSFNDIIAEPIGGIYAGTVYWDASGMIKPGKLLHISPQLKVSVIDDNVRLANGLGFSPDQRTLYFADSDARRIYAFDLASGDPIPKGKRVFVEVPKTEGVPDGLTVDAEGFVWSAQWFGSQVVRYDPKGRVDRRIAMPVTQVSSVMFGGPKLDDLYITSADELAPESIAPIGYDMSSPNRGGGLYRIHCDVTGRPELVSRFTT
jgi:D-xylonolactonase